MDFDVYEIFDCAIRNSDNTNELADNIASLIEDTLGSKFATKLSELFDKYCEDNSLCNVCGTAIEYKVAINESVEYFGFPAKEPIYIKHCPNCG